MSSGDERILSATFDKKSNYSTKVYSPDGTYIEIPDVESSGYFPLRLFGWSEIETLGRSYRKQRDLLDRLIPDLPDVLSRRSELRDKIALNRRKVDQCMEELRVAYEIRDGEMRKYKEYKDDFERINTSDIKELFTNLDLAKEKRQVLLKLYENSQTLHRDLTDENRTWLQNGVEELIAKGNDTLRQWWQEEESQILGLSAQEEGIKRKVGDAADLAQRFGLVITEHGSGVKESIDSINEDLQRRVAKDSSLQRISDLRANADTRLRRVTRLREDYQKKLQNLNESMQVRRVLCEKLGETQREISDIRARQNSEIDPVVSIK